MKKAIQYKPGDVVFAGKQHGAIYRSYKGQHSLILDNGQISGWYSESELIYDAAANQIPSHATLPFEVCMWMFKSKSVNPIGVLWWHFHGESDSYFIDSPDYISADGLSNRICPVYTIEDLMGFVKYRVEKRVASSRPHEDVNNASEQSEDYGKFLD